MLKIKAGPFFRSAVLLFLVYPTGKAFSQTWLTSPGSADWNTSTNWDLNSVPNGGSAAATFGTSSSASVDISANIAVSLIYFNGSSSFNIATQGNSVSITGFGINNVSGNSQVITNAGGNIYFENAAQAVSIHLNNTTSGSTIVFQDTSSAGSAQITNSGVLDFTGSSSSAAASICTSSGGSVSFSGTAAGGQAQFDIASGGTFDISQDSAGAVTTGSISGGGNFDLGADNLTTGLNNLSTTVTGVISGTDGSLTKTGIGTFTLTGNNTYTGGTSIIDGTLVVQGGSLGTGPTNNSSTLIYGLNSIAVSTVTNSGTLNFNDFSSAGSASITNLNLLNFNNSSSAFSSTISSTGVLNFNNDSTAGNSSLTNNGGTIFFHNGSTAGNASIQNQTSSAILFLGSSATTLASAGNAQIANNDLVEFEQFSTAGNAQIITNSGAVQFDSSAQGGTAHFTMGSGSYFDVSGSTVGGVTIGSIDGAGSINLGSNNLATGIDNLSTTISGVIFDGGNGGSLTKMGTGTLTLTNINTYNGSTHILDGSLAIGNASALGSSAVYLTGGNLLTAGGPLSISIGGNYIQGPTGTLSLGFAGSLAGEWDNLNIAGSANLDGSLFLFSESGFTPTLGETFDILTASSVTGHFSNLTDTITAFRLLPLYSNTQVTLVAIQPSFAQLGQTYNERSVGAALDKIYLDPTQQNLIYTLGIQQASTLNPIYDLISPDGLTPIFQMGFSTLQNRANISDRRLDSIGDEWDPTGSNLAALGDGRPLFASTLSPNEEKGLGYGSGSTEQVHTFVEGMTDFGTVTGDLNAAGYQFSMSGIVGGMDIRFEPGLAGGILLGYAGAQNSKSASSVTVTGGQAGLFGGWRKGELRVNAFADAGINNYQLARTGYVGNASGTTSGLQYGFHLDLGYDLTKGKTKLTPFLAGQYSSVQISAFQESGSATPLSFKNQGQTSLSSQLGMKFSDQWSMKDITLEPNLSAAWEHLHQGNLDQLNATLVNSGNNFTVEGPAMGTDGAVLDAGLNAQLDKQLALFVQYQGKLGMSRYDSQSFSGGLNLGF